VDFLTKLLNRHTHSPSVITTQEETDAHKKDFDVLLTLGVLEKVNEYATRHGANAKEMYDTIAKCENKALNPNQQSGHRYDFNSPKRDIVKGDQERSYGLAMIHLPDHPTITLENATDPEFALEWMAKEFAAGRESQWTCHTKLFGAY
jgi:hypothetical protein